MFFMLYHQVYSHYPVFIYGTLMTQMRQIIAVFLC